MSEPESLMVDEALDQHLRRHSLDRLVMLSDGVFAIAITLAALEIHIPNLPTFQGVIASLGIPLLAYIVSFQVIAVFWSSNRDLFARVYHVDKPLTVLVLMTLCLIALIPSSRGGWVCLHSDWQRISGSSAGCFFELPIWGVMQGGRSPTGMMPHIGGQTHAAITIGRLSKYV